MKLKKLVKKASEKDPRRTDELIELYQNTDMPEWEFIGHLKLIAGEE